MKPKNFLWCSEISRKNSLKSRFWSWKRQKPFINISNCVLQLRLVLKILNCTIEFTFRLLLIHSSSGNPFLTNKFCFRNWECSTQRKQLFPSWNLKYTKPKLKNVLKWSRFKSCVKTKHSFSKNQSTEFKTKFCKSRRKSKKTIFNWWWNGKLSKNCKILMKTF